MLTRRAFLKKYFARFMLSLALLGMIVYIVYHATDTPAHLMTVPARRITDTQVLGGEAYLFREETVLTVAQNGVVNSLADRGYKVGKDIKLAEVWIDYDADSILTVQKQLDIINRSIAVLEKSKVPAGTTVAMAETYRAEALQSCLSIRQSVLNGDYRKSAEWADQMLIALNRYAALIDSGASVDEALNELKEQKEELLKGSALSVYNIKASGYFYDASYVDGYEGIFNEAAVQNLTVDSFRQLKASEPQKSTDAFPAGKMAYGYQWFLALEFETDVSELFLSGNTYTLAFPENEGRSLDMQCRQVTLGDGSASVVVFETDVVPQDFRFLRTQRVEITVGTAVGYYIPEQAMTVLGGMDGVYIFENSTVYFRRVEILYRGDGYCIVAEQGDRGDEYLALNDIMITSGKNLYDGKVYE